MQVYVWKVMRKHLPACGHFSSTANILSSYLKSAMSSSFTSTADPAELFCVMRPRAGFTVVT